LIPRSLYVHVPFCARRCSYCDFAVQAVRKPPTQAWLSAVEAELGLLVRQRGWDLPMPVDTLYVGGGTPSLLGTGAMQALAESLRRYVVWDPATVEWTCEANPESLTPELACDWRAVGVNRVSLGVQTFHEPALRWMGRLHGTQGVVRAMLAAREAGFENVSVDLIFALPVRLGRDWDADLERALELEPEHLSLYGLTAEPGAPLGRWVADGRERLVDDERYAEEYLLAHERLTAAGFRHYEVSNFARGALVSRHNFVYWSGAPYLALGPGAHAFYPPLRRWNLRSWDAYREAVCAGRLPVEGEERVDAEAAAIERAWLALRTDRGYPLDDAAPEQAQLGAAWERRGWATRTAGALRLSASGWLLLDRLAVEFALAGAGASQGG
jgi:oxygen-independent coproporphyrinogen III oxidase